MTELESIYQKEWEDYRDKQSNGCLFGIAVLVVFILLFSFAQKYLGDWSGAVGLAVFFGLAIVGWIVQEKSRFKCPRCKRNYHSINQRLGESRERCRKCLLPIYFGSEWFYDRWGTEQGKQLIEEFKTHPREYL